MEGRKPGKEEVEYEPYLHEHRKSRAHTRPRLPGRLSGYGRL
jgi:hypothetical protein